MRVVQLLGPSTGGIRRTVLTLAAELRQRRVEVLVAGPAGVLDPIGVLDAVVPVPGAPTPIGLWRAARALRTVARPGDVVHAHGLKAAWVALVARRRPWILTIHNVVLGSRPQDRLLRRLERFVVARADDVIATSDEIEQDVTGIARRVVTIRPVHTVPAVRRSREEVRASLGLIEQRLAVCVARLHRQKGVDRLLEAWPSVPADCVLVVAGSGPEASTLDARRAALGLGDRVRFLGDRDDAVDFIAAADVVVIPSRWESGPLVLLEALACGRVVVTTRVGFVDEVVGASPPSGVIVIADDAEAGEFARAIGAALEDPARRLDAARGAERAAPFLDASSMVERTIARYEGLRR